MLKPISKQALLNKLTFLILVLIAVVGLREIIFSSGIVGHTWDWGIPNFPEQLRMQVKANFFVWDDRAFGGFFFPFRIEFLYWGIIYVFSFLGGETLSKAIPLVAMVFSGINMYVLAGRIFHLDRFWGLIAATLYMLSPFFYSRLIAGHLPILVGYAFLPLTAFLAFKLFARRNNSSRVSDNCLSLFLAMTIAFSALHPLIIFSSWALIALISIVCFFYPDRKSAILKFLKTTVFWLLLSSGWLVPIVNQAVFGAGGLSARPWQTISEEVGFRLPYFSSISRPFSELFTFSYSFGLNTEFVYPIPRSLQLPFSLVTTSLFALSMVAFYFRKRFGQRSFPTLILTILLFFGFGLVTGEKSAVGRFLYFFLIKFLPVLFSAFSNPLRLMPLVVFPFSLLSVVSLKEIEKKARFVVRALVLMGVTIFVYPWWGGSLLRPVIPFSEQPMSLKLNQINAEDKQVFDYLSGLTGDFRMVHLPPAYVSWPGETDLSYVWNTLTPPKPSFLEYSQPLLSKAVIEELYTPGSSTNLSKLLGLAAVKTIIYPHYEKFESYQGFIQKTKNYKPRVDINWQSQKGILKQKSQFETVDFYENQDFLPHFFIAEEVTWSSDITVSLLTNIVSLPEYRLKNAIITEQKKLGEKMMLQPLADTYYVKPTCAGCEPEYIDPLELSPIPRLLPTSPFYFLNTLKEEPVSGIPFEKAYSYLLRATKKIEETKLMILNEKDNLPQSELALQNYLSLLTEYENQLTIILSETPSHNQLLIRSQVFLNKHKKDLQEISLKTRSGWVANYAKMSLDRVASLLERLKTEVWATESNREIKYLVNITEPGNYQILKKDFLDIQYLEELRIDDRPVNLDGKKPFGEWQLLADLYLDAGTHRLQANLGAAPNLFSEIATNSAVRKTGTDQFELIFQDQVATVESEVKNLDSKVEYRISFRYRLLGEPIRVTFEQEGDEIINKIWSPRVDNFLVDTSQWRKFDQTFVPHVGSQSGSLKFYLSAGGGRADSCLIENVKIEPVYYPEFLLYSTSKKRVGYFPEIETEKRSPTRYRVKVKNALAPFFLVFSESYNGDWKAYINKKGLPREKVSEEKHVLVNTFANAWYLEEDGDYTVDVEFVPQRVYVGGLVFAGIWWLLGAVVGMVFVVKSLRANE